MYMLAMGTLGLTFYMLSLIYHKKETSKETTYLYIQDSCHRDDDYRDLVESIIDKWLG